MPSRGIDSTKTKELLAQAKLAAALHDKLVAVGSNPSLIPPGTAYVEVVPDAAAAETLDSKPAALPVANTEQPTSASIAASVAPSIPRVAAARQARGSPKSRPASATSPSSKPKYSKKTRFQGRKSLERALLDIGGTKLPTIQELREVLFDEDSAIKYMAECGIIDFHDGKCPRCGLLAEHKWDRKTISCKKTACGLIKPDHCERCLDDVTDVVNEDGRHEVRCVNEDCRWFWRRGKPFQCSFFRGSLLQKCKLPKNEVLHLFYLWLQKVPAKTAASMLGWRADTAGRWLKHLRQIVTEMILTGDFSDVVLGGPGIIVEIDESKFGKRKYNRGRRANGDWVMGMVERTTRRRIVMIVVKDRSAETLLPIVSKFIAPGSIIHSDMWKAYGNISSIPLRNYEHRTLCHKDEFVASDEWGTHTQTIEGNWGSCKREIPIQIRTGQDLQDYLFEFSWRRQNAGDLWPAMLHALSNVRYTQRELEELNLHRLDASENMDSDYEDTVPSFDEDLPAVGSSSSYDSVNSHHSAPN